LTSDGLARVRRLYARQMLSRSGLTDPALEEAFASVPREAFLGPPPWRVSGFAGLHTMAGDDPSLVYQDALFALDPARGVNNGSPALHALMLHRLGVRPGQTVAHIGAGSGYYTAILSELVGLGGRVLAVEIDARLAAMARAALAGRANVTVIEGDGGTSPDAPVDRIYVNYAVADLMPAWIEGLADAGRLIVPIGVAAQGRPNAASGAAFLIERMAAGFAATHLCAVGFVVAEGMARAQAAAGQAAAGLAAAFGRGGAEFVRSLRWRTQADPARCWFWSAGWSFSYDAPG
jgi:protein-L-isoaspartate(D-aspartate) O-methyltransferase